ncbi:hypothetical protein [uncultured Roseovarius sp.]|uniref:hypothetical protein n=1 Tax=uncultured Roseovarius sp. TaxID=293344 RepID=UPI002634E3D5|nr:hypothetical protein [uncultured Roseovarius sp.]
MLRCLLVLVILSPWLVLEARAGAWPREKGQGFLSVSGQIDQPDDFGFYNHFIGLYAEYGATDRLTLGLDLGGDTLRMTKGIAFARWPLGQLERPLKLAVEIGLGQVDGQNALRPGLSVGQGFTIWDRHGWAAVDGRLVLFKSGGHTLESDMTIGLSTSRRSKTILQIQTGRPAHGRPYTRLAPSFVYRMRPGAYLEFGLIAPLSGSGKRGLKLGIWRKF